MRVQTNPGASERSGVGRRRFARTRALASEATMKPMKPVEQTPARDAYDRWAAIYDDEDNPLVALDERFVPPQLGDLRGREVLELACGTGRHTVRLASAGARVTAVDFSEGMLAKARARLAASDVRFEVGDV